MRHASAALIALLNSANEFFVADLLTITPLSGSSTYLTSAATDITCVSQVDSGSHTFKAGGVDASGVFRPSFSAGQTKILVGTEADNLDLVLMSNILATIGGISWTQQARNGYFDGARICLERVLTATWGDWTAGTLIRFWGRAANVAPTRNTIAITVVSDLILLQRPTPKNVYTPGCLHNLYDTGCTLVKATFTVSGAVIAGSTASSINTNLSAADHYYEQGAITFTSGVNSGLTRSVKTSLNASGNIVPTATLPAAPANGDTFTIYPGCDKTQATCTSKFSNLAHYRGYPYVPPPESAS